MGKVLQPCGHIPYAVCKANGVPPLGIEDEDEDEGESEIDVGEHRRGGGRPWNGSKDNHSRDEIEDLDNQKGIYPHKL